MVYAKWKKYIFLFFCVIRSSYNVKTISFSFKRLLTFPLLFFVFSFQLYDDAVGNCPFVVCVSHFFLPLYWEVLSWFNILITLYPCIRIYVLLCVEPPFSLTHTHWATETTQFISRYAPVKGKQTLPINLLFSTNPNPFPLNRIMQPLYPFSRDECVCVCVLNYKHPAKFNSELLIFS